MTEQNEFQKAWEQYEHVLEKLLDRIIEDVPPSEEYSSFNGREWCEENNINERMFAHAVEIPGYDKLDYGISPMHPWKIDY